MLATRNEHKVAELSRILAAAGFADRLTGLDAFPGAPDVPETGLTFADNALLKAHAIAAYTGLPAVADDSGLCVDALHGMPGCSRPAGRASTATTAPTWTWFSASSATSRRAAPSSSAWPPWSCRRSRRHRMAPGASGPRRACSRAS